MKDQKCGARILGISFELAHLDKLVIQLSDKIDFIQAHNNSTEER